ncbi:MAG: hypothetical protein V2A62_02525 [Candidatus Woesearchaeota archaeon]
MRTIRRGLIALLTAGTLAASYFGCSSSNSNSCGSDKDCNQQKGEICVERQCVPYQLPTETPQQVFDNWTATFARNDLEGSLQYWDPGKEDLCRKWFTDQDFLIQRGIIPSEGLPQEEVLPYLARQIQGATLVPTAVKGNYQEFKLEKACNVEQDCPKQVPCIANKCSGDQKIVFTSMYDKINQKGVYKIGSF